MLNFRKSDILKFPNFENSKYRIVELSKFENFPLKAWNKSIKANLNSMFLCSQVFGKAMIKQKKSSIINISSTYGIVGPDQKIYVRKKTGQTFYKNPAYPTAKGAVISFTKYLAAYCLATLGGNNNPSKLPLNIKS